MRCSAACAAFMHVMCGSARPAPAEDSTSCAEPNPAPELLTGNLCVIISSNDYVFDAYIPLNVMRTTINLDDDLLAEATRLLGITEKTALVREGLKSLIERESARRLAALGGSASNMKPVARRRSDGA